MKTFMEYDKNKAVEYAKRYCLVPNPQYKDYTKYGGDCTNFISQCIHAGNIPFDNDGKWETQKWYWYSDQNRVATWTSPEAFKKYLLGNNKEHTQNFGVYAKEITYDDLEWGDIVMLSRGGATYHAMIVSEIIIDENQNVLDYLICQRTINLLDYPLSYKEGDKSYIRILGYYK